MMFTSPKKSWTIRDYVYITAESIVGLLIILVNGFVLAALCRYRYLRTVTNFYIGSLAVADVLVGLLVPPLVVVAYAGLPQDFHACVLVNSLVGVFINISVLSLVCVALDRYWAAMHPVSRLNVLTKGRAVMIVAATWTLGIFVGFFPFMGWHKNPDGFELCSYRRVIDVEYNVYIRFFGFKFPLLLAMLYLHARMFCAFHRAQKQKNIILFRLIRINVSDGSNKRVQMKLFKTMALIFVVFTLFWVPLFIVNCIALWSPATPVDINMTLFAVILTHACSFVNPIIYAVNQPSFR